MFVTDLERRNMPLYLHKEQYWIVGQLSRAATRTTQAIQIQVTRQSRFSYPRPHFFRTSSRFRRPHWRPNRKPPTRPLLPWGGKDRTRMTNLATRRRHNNDRQDPKMLFQNS